MENIELRQRKILKIVQKRKRKKEKGYKTKENQSHFKLFKNKTKKIKKNS